VIAFNGEIYNHRELREELRTRHCATFATAGDAEVVVAAHHHWGGAAPGRLRGMFAYAIWDRHEHRVTGARDPFGIKPLAYLTSADSLVLASEQKALLPFAAGLVDPAGDGSVDDAVDGAALSHYLTLQYVPEPATLRHGIARLPAGHTFSYRPGGELELRQYARPSFRPTRQRNLDAAAGRIRDALRASVRAHLAADVPVGAFLSGGIDSTAVVALAREVQPDLQTFTVGFDVPGYSETSLAELSARQLGVSTTPVTVTAEDARAALPTIVWHLDDPVADPSLVPLYFLARRAARDVTVALSGEGADELFGGYRIYREPLSLAPLTALPMPVRRAMRAVARTMPEGVRGRSLLDRAGAELTERYYGNARIFDDAEKAVLMRRHDPRVRHTDVTAASYATTRGLDDVARMQDVDLRTWLTGDILTKADRMSMAHGLELRVPYLDPEVFAAAADLPRRYKVPRLGGGGGTKVALRRALRDILPPGVVARPKLGLPTPTRVWLRGQLGRWADGVFAASGAGGLVDLAYARHLLREHRDGRADHSRKVWTVLVLCIWYGVFVDRTISPVDTARPEIPVPRQVRRVAAGSLG
jgi:asparagine synthase (glutamine-hydrolysing)